MRQIACEKMGQTYRSLKKLSNIILVCTTRLLRQETYLYHFKERSSVILAMRLRGFELQLLGKPRNSQCMGSGLYLETIFGDLQPSLKVFNLRIRRRVKKDATNAGKDELVE
ncbi:uncharacterized protein ARMOST_07480 [Armillaria ostoyae]|uniref:Uncharacterized protein n=1 Tax=Armillaria ostoyae TaxID=47428 RepID=A0A284R5Z7_ARMOS|nr:uncharacterized protein ARMOST_07480 [Armillaria ostoyae]